MSLPRNGQALIGARMNGMKPSGLVVVSLVGNIGCPNWTLQPDIESIEKTDWTLLVGLDVEIVTSMAFPVSRLIPMLAAMAEAVPASLLLTYTEGMRVELGESRQLPPAADGKVYRLFDWTPTAIGPVRYRDSVKLQQRLAREVGKAFPDYWIETMSLIVERMKQGKEAWQA